VAIWPSAVAHSGETHPSRKREVRNLQVAPTQATYHSDERKPRRFEILVAGRRIAETTIDRSEPPRFFDVEHAIPAELTLDEQRVTVRFQAAAEQQIGAVYGVRMIRADALR